MAGHQVILESTDECFRCSDHENVLVGMARLGHRGIPVGCRNGGCGVCKVEVIRGSYASRVMSRDHVSETDEAAGRVLACRITPTSDLVILVIGKLARAIPDLDHGQLDFTIGPGAGQTD